MSGEDWMAFGRNPSRFILPAKRNFVLRVTSGINL
jgi:hypothetical protein